MELRGPFPHHTWCHRCKAYLSAVQNEITHDGAWRLPIITGSRYNSRVQHPRSQHAGRLGITRHGPLVLPAKNRSYAASPLRDLPYSRDLLGTRRSPQGGSQLHQPTGSLDQLSSCNRTAASLQRTRPTQTPIWLGLHLQWSYLFERRISQEYPA